ncbi:MAG TPA: corrinoid protein [Candidatus Acidoferrum sp.]|nr:corrinoid protein [Candidatus Acidoferrum sp.]
MIDPAEFYRSLREAEVAPVEELVRKALADGHSAAEVLNQGLIGGMAIIGREFKARDLWVPDVLLAARNMKQGVAILQPLFSREGQKAKGTIVLGTVKGDIHDIGKNLVAIMMSGSGIEVIDLGIDVPLEKFLAAVEERKPQIVGLSALLTTTMLEMRKVIEAIRKIPSPNKPRIIVGGAPLTEAFAKEIGADGYGADAVAAVELALKLLERGPQDDARAR